MENKLTSPYSMRIDINDRNNFQRVEYAQLGEWNVHDWIYAEITDYKCFDGLALGKEFYKKFLYWSRMHYE